MNPSAWSPFVLSLLRLMSGLLFLEHGTSKVLGFPPSHSMGHFELFTTMGFSGVLEFVGGILLVVGLFTRITAFILSGEMAVAYFMAHAPKGFYPMSGGGNGGELAVLYCFVFLYLVVAGGGPWSLDRLIRRRS
jgi:putative oxidoreductase